MALTKKAAGAGTPSGLRKSSCGGTDPKIAHRPTFSNPKTRKSLGPPALAVRLRCHLSDEGAFVGFTCEVAP